MKLKYSKDGTALIKGTPGTYEEIRIKDGTKQIETGAMRGLDIGKLYVPASVDDIGGRHGRNGVVFKNQSYTAFDGSTIGELEFAEGTESIDRYAFYGAKIGKIIFPQSLLRIKDSAFYGAGLKSVSLPDGLLQVWGEAFLGCCMEEVDVPASLWLMQREAFGDSIKLARLVDADHVVQFIDAQVDYGSHARIGRPIIIEVGSSGFTFAMPSNIRPGNDFLKFRDGWYSCPEKAMESAKYAYRLAANPIVKQETALESLMMHPDDAELRKYVSRSAKQIVARCVSDGNTGRLAAFLRMGILKKPALEELMGYIRDETCRAYIIQLLEGTGCRKSMRL